MPGIGGEFRQAMRVRHELARCRVPTRTSDTAIAIRLAACAVARASPLDLAITCFPHSLRGSMHHLADAGLGDARRLQAPEPSLCEQTEAELRVDIH
jgi:hypothetical protein